MPRPTPLIAPLALGLLAFACKSPASHAADADREVYEILRDLRREMDASGEGDFGAFTIDPPTDTLRERLLAGGDELAPLTLTDCLVIAAEGNRTYMAQRESLYRTALDLTLERWEFSVQENGTFGAFLFGTGREADETGFLPALGVTRLLGTGLELATGLGFSLVRDVSTGGGWASASDVSFTLVGPLLRGFGRHIVEENLTQAERDVLYAARGYETFRRDLAVQVANRFFQTLALYDRLQNEEANYERRTRLRERNEAFAEAGQLTEIEVDQARQDELSARDRLVDARRDLEASLDDFKFFLGLPIEVPIALDLASRESAGEWEAVAAVVAEEIAVPTALERRLDLRTTIDRLEDARRGVGVDADALRAGLQLTAAAGVSSDVNKPLAFSQDPDWSLALDFDAPFERRAERNAYRRALIDLQVAMRDAIEEEDRVKTEVRDALRNLAAARESYAIQKNAVTLAERRVESTQLSLEAGRVETRDVLESQNALIAAQNDASSAFTDFILAGVDLYRTMELLFVDGEGIQLDHEALRTVEVEESVEQRP